VRGGNPPYHFVLDTLGGFPPMGLIMDQNGLIRGTPKVKGTSEFRVCAVDMSGSQSCQDFKITVNPKGPTKERQKDGQNSGSSVMPILLLGGAGAAAAAGAAAYLSQGKGSNCGTSPAADVNAACLGPNRDSSACNAAVARMTSFCQCSGFQTFNVSTGSCQ